MKVICDVHISFKLVKFLNENNIETLHVNHLLKKWHSSDKEISEFADTNNLVVITKDADFRNSFFLQKKPKRLIKISLGNISNRELITIFEKNTKKFIDVYDNYDCFYIEIAKDNISIIINNS